MKKKLIMLFIILFFYSIAFAYFQPRTAEEIITYYKDNNFKYVWIINQEVWQEPEATLKLKTGDCKAYALLNSYFLNNMRIENQIIVITYKELNIKHAICAFKSGNYYTILSNTEMLHTNQKTLDKALLQIYPDMLTYEIK